MGVVLVLAGVVVGLSPTLGLTNVTADRGISVATADDGAALIALEATDVEVDSTNGETVAKLRNNAGEPLSTTYRISTDTDDLTIQTSDGQTTLGTDGELAISLACRPGNRQGNAQLQVTVPTADGATVSISNAILTVDVSYDCPPGGGNQGPPGGNPAFNDADGDGQYDSGETSYTADQLQDFDNDTVDLVVDGAGTVDTKKNQDIGISAKSVTFVDSGLSPKNGGVQIDSDGDIVLQNASIDAKNADISLTASGDIDIEQSRIENKNADITFDSGGNISLIDTAVVSSGQATATLATDGTLAVDGLSISDGDDVLTYSPSGATVTGTPNQGTVTDG